MVKSPRFKCLIEAHHGCFRPFDECCKVRKAYDGHSNDRSEMYEEGHEGHFSTLKQQVWQFQHDVGGVDDIQSKEAYADESLSLALQHLKLSSLQVYIQREDSHFAGD